MRIGLFTTDFPFKGPFTIKRSDDVTYFWGGTAEVVYHLAMALNAKGHQVKIFTISPTSEDIFQEYQGISVYRYAKDLQVASTWLSSGILWKPLQHDLDLVHGHLGTPPGPFAASIYSAVKRKPFVLTIHTTYNDVSLKGGSIVRKLSMMFSMSFLNKRLLRRADAITTVSMPVLAESPAFQEFIDAAVLIPNGVDAKSIAPPTDKEKCKRCLGIDPTKPVILCVASLSPYKDPATLVEAFEKMESNPQDPYLIMIGDGPLRPELIEKLERSGRGDCSRFPGFVSEEKKLAYFEAADVLVLPSLAEAFGIVILEAASFGLPVVTSDIEVFRQMVEDRRNGLLFRAGDAQDLKEKLSTILEDREHMREMGLHARELAERYDWRILIDRYCDVYRGLVH